MALDTPLPTSAQQKLQELRQQIEAAFEGLMAEMQAAVAADREAAVGEARAAAQREADEAVAKVRAESEALVAERVAAARAEAEAAARSAAASFVDDRVTAAQAEAERKLAEAVSATEERAAQAVAAERALGEQQVAEAHARAAAELADTRAQERQCELSCLERLLDAARDLDSSASLSQVLDRLATQASAHIARVAVLIVRGEELRGWRFTGFDEVGSAEPSSVSVPLDGGTIVARAVETGARTATTDATAERPLQPLPFAQLRSERIGLAVPLTVGVRTVAVLYADEGQGEIIVPSPWPEALELLARHASARLELLTMARAYGLHAQPYADGGPSPATGASSPQRPAGAPSPIVAALSGARSAGLANGQGAEPAGDRQLDRQISEEDGSALRYARLLISEIKLYHEDAVNEGRRNANLLTRLGPEIARARRLYEERVPAEVRRRADHFGQELVRTLANGDPRLLGQVT